MHQEQAGYANLVLDAELKKCAPPLDGRATPPLLRVFFYTTLERLPLLDYILNQFTKKACQQAGRAGTRCCGRGLARRGT